MRAALAVVLLLCPAGSALAQRPLPTRLLVARHLERAATRKQQGNLTRYAHELLAALAADPGRYEPWLRLVDFWPEQREVLVRECYLRQPEHPLVKLAAKGRLGLLPERRKWGRATKLALFYPARSLRDLTRDRRPSLDVGATLDPRLLIVHATDDAGHLVPTDLSWRGEGGLEQDGEGRWVARHPSRSAALIAQDRKTGLTAKLTLRLVGPTARIDAAISRTAGVPKLYAGQMLHLRARSFDALGQRVWSQRLLWTARTPAGQPLPRALERSYSLMHLEVAHEPHVNSVIGRDPQPHVGPIALTVVDPTSGARAQLSVEAVAERQAPPKREIPGWSWEADLASAQAKSRATGKPVLLYYYAQWCPLCTRLERTTLRDAEVTALAQQFVTVRLDSDRHIRDVMKHRVRDLPSLMFYAPDRSWLGHVEPRDRFAPPRLMAAMRKALGDAPRVIARGQRLEAALGEAPESIEAMDRLIDHMLRVRKWEDAYPLALESFRQASATGRKDADWRLSQMLHLDLKLRNFQRAGQAIEAFLQQYPDSPYRERVEYYRGLQRFYGKGDLDGAANAWVEQLERYPTGKWNAQGRRMLKRAQDLQRDRERLGKDFPQDWNAGK